MGHARRAVWQSNLERYPVTMRISTIVSGGQTGADRAALDWAIDQGIPHGGWCPKGRIAEDGVIDLRYRLTELENGSYRRRTRQNVLDSDATLILNLGELDGGSLETRRIAELNDKPCLVIQLDNGIATDILQCTRTWLHDTGAKILNIAGPRESKRPGIYALAVRFLDEVMSLTAK